MSPAMPTSPGLIKNDEEDPNATAPVNAKPKVPALGAAPVTPPPTMTPVGSPATATADPMAFAPSGTVAGGEMVNAQAPPAQAPPAGPNVNPIPTNQPQIAPPVAPPVTPASPAPPNVNPQMPTTPLGAAPTAGAPDFRGMSVADAVQARYKWEREQENATGIAGKEQDYSTQGMIDSGTWDETPEQKAENEARRQQIINDPTTSPGIKAAFEAGAGTHAFDRAMNQQGTPESQYLGALSTPTREYAPPPQGDPRFLTGGQEVDANGMPIPGGYNADADKARQLAAQGVPAGGTDANGLPTAPRAAPTGPANDAGGGMIANPGGILTEGAGLGGAGPTAQAPDPYRGGITNTDPNNSLLGKTLLAGPETDRYGIAQDRLKSWDAASDPYFKANLREATQNAAGRGQVGSGMLRGRLGDVTQQHDLQRQTAGEGFLQNALEGSIGDAYKNIGIAQDQQKFQQGQQESAFSQQAVSAQIEEALRSGDFNRAMQLLGAGNMGNPSDTAMGLSGIFGGQANAANGALGGLVGNTVKNNSAQTAQGIPKWLEDYLKSIGGGGAVPSQNPQDN